MTGGVIGLSGVFGNHKKSCVERVNIPAKGIGEADARFREWNG